VRDAPRTGSSKAVTLAGKHALFAALSVSARLSGRSRARMVFDMRVQRRLSVVLLSVLWLAAGCAANKKDHTVCPEYREQRCVAGARCSMDHARGCRVCQCDPVDVPSEGPPDSNAHPPE
jgi:hypothetical protein